MSAEPLPDSVAELLEPIRAAPASSAVLTDFDGTISPIVRDAGEARALPEAVALLHELAGTYACVAVVSGRPAAFLAEQLDLPAAASPLVAVGLYGLERTGRTGVVHALPGVDRWRPVVEEAAARADGEVPEGVFVERKGLTVTLHWRPVPAAEPEVAALAGHLAGDLGLEVRPGRMSLELAPPIPFDKGLVVEELTAGLAGAVYAGDDVGDLPAFAALRRLKAAGKHAVTIAVVDDEVPEELVDAADGRLDGIDGMLALLRFLRSPL